MRTFVFLLVSGSMLMLDAQAIRRDPEFNSEAVERNDDGSSGLVPLGFTLNFFGRVRNSCYVNNNGNITFDEALSTYTPFGLTAAQREIIAPFFADVDTRNPLSNLVRFGRTRINGRPAFGVNYIDVGYFSSHADKLNRFQLVLIERSDTGEGNFDIEFNYERVLWETGDASGGTGGYGGTPVIVGWSNGSGEPDTSLELNGSAVSLSFVDNGRRALVRQRLNSDIFGRLLFRARGGKILPQLSVSSGAVLREGTVGQPYSATLSSIGGSAPYRWSITPDTVMVPGLTLDAATGVISGIPTAPGTTSFTINLTARTEDGDRQVSGRSSITIVPPKIQISTASNLPSATLNRSYSQRLAASGASAGYRWTIDDSSSLPPGVTFSPDGSVGGTPQREGVYGFTARATSVAEDGAQPAERYFRLTVAPGATALNATCSLQPATTGVPYTQLLRAEGGTAPYTYRLLGQMPLGLTLDSVRGSINGTPSVSGDFSFAVEVRDARANVQTTSCSFNVTEPELAVQGCPLPLTSVGTAISTSLSASGGEGPYTWSIIGTLPSGVSLSPDGVIAGTPRQSGGFLFRVVAADREGRQTASACGLTVMPTPLSAGYCVLPQATESQPYTQILSPRGGEAPHIWRVIGELPEGLSLSAAGVANGTPVRAGDYAFNVHITDARGFTAVQSCNMNVKAQPMRLESACPLPSAKVGTAYSERLTAVGGQAPHHFTVQGTLPEGLTLASNGTITGRSDTVTQRGFQVEIRDAAGAVTRQGCSLGVTLPTLPSIRVAGVPTTVPAANTSLAPVIELSSAYPLPIQGTLSIETTPETNSPEADANQADPRVRFVNGFQTSSFTIPAGTRSLRLPVATTGTVAGSIGFRVENLRSSGTAISSVVSPAVTRMAPSAATLTDACYAKTSTGAYEMRVTGFSNTRELEWAIVDITGTTLQRIDIAGYSADYFASSLSIRSGGAFTVSFPFTLTGTSTPTANVTISNSYGRSQTRQAQQCR
jgi:hypothetical protein